MGSSDRELDALSAARQIAKRAGLLEQAKGGGWAGWTSPRWVLLQVLGVIALGAIAESQPSFPRGSTWILLAGLVISHLMLLGQRLDAVVALAEPDDVRESQEP